MKKLDAIDKAGSSAALARLLGIAPAAISQWGEKVPAARVWQLQVIKPEWFSQLKPSIVANRAELPAQPTTTKGINHG